MRSLQSWVRLCFCPIAMTTITKRCSFAQWLRPFFLLYIYKQMPCFFIYVTLSQQYFNILLSNECQTFCFISLLNLIPYKMIVILMQDDSKNPFESDFVPNTNQLRNVQNSSVLQPCCQVTNRSLAF